MAEFKSSLGNTSYTDQPGRVLTVDDPREQSPLHPVYQDGPPQMPPQGARPLTEEERAEFMRRRQEVQAQQSKVSPTTRQRMEYLTGIGRIRDNFVFQDEAGKEVTFQLQSLKNQDLIEIHDIMVQLGEVTNAKFNMLLRNQLLARSLWAIDGILLEEIIGSNEFQSKLDLIASLDENLVEYMHKFYEEKISKVGQKYTPQTPEEVKELDEDLKK